MGKSVTVTAADGGPAPARTSASETPPWRADVFRQPIDYEGRFEVRVPFRAAALRVCIDGFDSASMTESDRCHDVPVRDGNASIAIYCHLWEYSMEWSIGYPTPLE